MNSSFPFVKGRDWGYYPDDVDTFIATARKIYDETFSQMTPGLPPGHAAIKAKDIRQVSFRRTRGGYSTQHVDDALDRLESVFLEREKVVFISQSGESAWNEHLAQERAAIVEHTSRKPKQLFRRVGSFSSGYSVSQVRAIVEKIRDHFVLGEALSAQDVRTVQFASKKRGFNENQVDAFLDAVINVLAYEEPGAPLAPYVPPAEAEEVVTEQSPVIDAPTVPLTEASVAPANVAAENAAPVVDVSTGAVPPTAAAAVAAMWTTENTAEAPTNPQTSVPGQTLDAPQAPTVAETPVAPYVPPIVPGSYAAAASEWASGGTGPVSSETPTGETVPVPPVSAVASSSAPDLGVANASDAGASSSELPNSDESKTDEKPDEDDFFAQFK